MKLTPKQKANQAFIEKIKTLQIQTGHSSAPYPPKPPNCPSCGGETEITGPLIHAGKFGPINVDLQMIRHASKHRHDGAEENSFAA